MQIVCEAVPTKTLGLSARAPYLWNPTTYTFITYDDPQSIEEKAKFIKKERGLGGAMFWHYHADDGSLLDSPYSKLVKPSE